MLYSNVKIHDLTLCFSKSPNKLRIAERRPYDLVSRHSVASAKQHSTAPINFLDSHSCASFLPEFLFCLLRSLKYLFWPWCSPAHRCSSPCARFCRGGRSRSSRLSALCCGMVFALWYAYTYSAKNQKNDNRTNLWLFTRRIFPAMHWSS